MRPPVTKADFLNRLLQFDFTGFGSLGATAVSRVSDHAVRVVLPTGTFKVSVQRPLPEANRAAARERWHKRFGRKDKAAKRNASRKAKAPSKPQQSQSAETAH